VSKPTYLRFHLEPNDDEEITCLFCNGPRCEQATRVSGGNRVTFYGVHNACAEKHMDKIHGPTKAAGEE